MDLMNLPFGGTINKMAASETRWWRVSWSLAFAVLTVILMPAHAADRSHLPQTCESTIYCYGPLLDTVQMAGIYPDSKTFVDMKMKYPANDTLLQFDIMMNKTGQRPTRADIEEFVGNNFDPEGSEFDTWVPTDWKEHPAFLLKIKDPELKEWAFHLNRLWLQLGRKMTDKVKENQDLYSIIYVDHPVIVPGGRFREFYYWDSYWIIRGLLLSEMRTTVRGMLSNFIDIVDRLGHIPNGGRIYYLMRSQPPLLVPMVKTYLDETGDLDYLRANLHTLDREFDFWMNNHTVDVEHEGIKYKLGRYMDRSQGPRPESYREDIESAKVFDSEDKKEEYYAELKAAAESGWDFSTRWFILNGTNKGNLTNLKTRSIIPVDLNAILCWNADILSEFHGKVGNLVKQAYYHEISAKFMDAIDKVLWHEEIGVWLDYDLEAGRRRDYFYPSNIAPMWTNSYDLARKEYYVTRVMKYLHNTKVDNYEGGIPTTFEHSGEQWDYPNAWPPLQHIMVTGLANSGLPPAQRLAREWATKWVRSNHAAWKIKSAMFEKYDATIVGGFGGGGEYQLQIGFGWTNGVIMELLNTYGADAFEGVPEEEGEGAGRGAAVLGAAVGAGGVATAMLAVLATLAAGTLGWDTLTDITVGVFYACYLCTLISATSMSVTKFMVYRKRNEHLMASSFIPEGVHLLRKGSPQAYTELRPMLSNGSKR